MCHSSFVANGTKKHKRFGETFTLEYARLYSSVLPRKCGHVGTRLVCEPVNDGIYRLQTLPDIGAVSSYTIFGLSKFQKGRLRVFENRVLRRLLGPKRDEVTGDWRKLHNEELSGLYSSLNTFRVIKSRRMRWVGHVARMARAKVSTGFRWGNPREGDHQA
jgi:hypothetical protein